MKLLNRLFRTKRNSPPGSAQNKEPAASPDDLFTALERDTMDFGEFRQRVEHLIWRDDHQGLRQLCQDQPIVAPLFTEKAIGEIAPGNKWNDMLWLMAQRLIDAGDVSYLRTSLEVKRHLVPNPDLGRKAMEPFVVTTNTSLPDEVLKLPVSLLRLLHSDITGIDPQNDATIDRVFADLVMIGPGFLHKYLSSIDFPYGDHALLRVPMGRPPQLKILEGRALRGKARLVPLVFDKFEAILNPYRAGKIRDATQSERDLFYSLIDFEIEGRPVYVIQADEGTLLIYLEEGDRIRWIESLDVWQSEDRSRPLGPLNSSTLDALRGEMA